MLKREWLATKGLAIAGARGRLSREAIKAVAKAEKDFKDNGTPLPWNDISEPDMVDVNVERVTRKVHAPVPNNPVKRVETVAWAIDNGTLIALQYCGDCTKTISRCIHKVPMIPAYLGGGEAMLVKPNA